MDGVDGLYEDVQIIPVYLSIMAEESNASQYRNRMRGKNNRIRVFGVLTSACFPAHDISTDISPSVDDGGGSKLEL